MIRELRDLELLLADHDSILDSELIWMLFPKQKKDSTQGNLEWLEPLKFKQLPH
jgi:hypothetical protein